MWNHETRDPERPRFLIRNLQYLLGLFLSALLLQSALPFNSMADLPPCKAKFLILYGSSTKLPAHTLFNSGLLPALKAAGIDDSEMHQEYLDIQHNYRRDYQRCLVDYLRMKYAGDRFEVIITFQPDALQFMLQEGKDLFSGATIVAAVPKTMTGAASSGRKILQTVYSFDSLSTLQYALALFPDTKEIIIISGPTAADYPQLENAQEAVKKFEGKLTVSYLTNHPLPEILNEVAKERDHAIILYTRLSSDSTGKEYIPKTVLTEISRAAKSPVFGLHDSLLGAGIVGGNLLSFKELGKEIAGFSIDLINNKRNTQASQSSFLKHTPMFDWAEMQRWKLDKSGLPKESVLINYRPGFLEQYWLYAIIALLFFAVEASLIFYLIWCRRSRIQSEKQLHKSEELLTSYLHSSAVISWMKDEDGRYVFLSDNYQKRFQVRFEDWNGKTDFELWPHGDAEKFRCDDQSVLNGGQPLEHIEVVTDSNGVISWWMTTKFLYQDAAGKRFIGGLGVDITELKQAETAQLKSAQYSRSLIEASLDPLVTISKDGKIMDVNQATVEVTGVPREKLIGTDFSDYFTDPACARIGYETVWRDGSIRDYPLSIHHFSGCVTEVLYNATLYRDQQGEVLGIFAAARDITKLRHAEEERLDLERQMLQAQKFESLGVMAGGIAHDFNNILTSIIGNTELALMRLDPESPVLVNLKRIGTSAQRAAGLAHQMLTYSGKGKYLVEAVNISTLIEEIGHLIKASISKKAELSLNLASPLPNVTADVAQIRQVVMNLITNASEALGDQAGTINITTGWKNCDRDYLRGAWLSDNIDEGLYVFLEVADTGCGMDKETQAKIFDPFFTTKFTGRGLGLPAVQGIIRGHKGSIQIYSEPGKGSLIRILLPASKEQAEYVSLEQQEAGFHGEGTILMVDDEEHVRDVGKEMLQQLGFTVLVANDGYEALNVYKENPSVAGIILDLTMPHMDGEECFRELRKINPKVKVIMSSGYSVHEIVHKFANKGLAGFIQKPYTLSSLREVLMKLADCRHAPAAPEG